MTVLLGNGMRFLLTCTAMLALPMFVVCAATQNVKAVEPSRDEKLVQLERDAIESIRRRTADSKSIEIQARSYLVWGAPIAEATDPAFDIGNDASEGETALSVIEYLFEDVKCTNRIRVFEMASEDAAVEALGLPTSRREVGFNGISQKKLTVVDAPMPFGEIVMDRTREHEIRTYVDVIPICLWHNTLAVLSDMGWDCERIEASSDSLPEPSSNIVRLNVRRISGRRWAGVLELDAAAGYVPVKWSSSLDGKLSTSIQIVYKKDEVHGNIPQSWAFRKYGGEGGREWLRRGQLRLLRINEDIEDNRFEIDFPEGTHVTMRSGGDITGYRKVAHDQLVGISDQQFGRADEEGNAPNGLFLPWVGLLLTGVVATGLTCAVVAKRLR